MKVSILVTLNGLQTGFRLHQRTLCAASEWNPFVRTHLFHRSTIPAYNVEDSEPLKDQTARAVWFPLASLYRGTNFYLDVFAMVGFKGKPQGYCCHSGTC